MVNELSVKELDLLQRIDETEELRPFFFRKAKGLKWFTPLAERGYFNPEANPKPVPAKQEGYVHLPTWTVVEYLVKTAPELADENNREYSEEFLNILVKATVYAKRNEFSNHRTWWQCAEIVSQIPHCSISFESIDIIDYWLDDKYERGLIAHVIGEKWLPKLLQLDDTHAIKLAKRIIEILYKVKFVESDFGGKKRQEASLRFNYHYANKITEKTAGLAGEKIGYDIVQIYDGFLISILKHHKNDTWSSIWRPAIENHEQNKSRDDAENILIQAYRDSLDGYFRNSLHEASDYVQSMLVSDYQTIQRLAIYVLSRNYQFFPNAVEQLLDEKYLESNYRHEMWHFLNNNYQYFSVQQKEKLVELISTITRHDDTGEYHEGATAYYKAIWFSAIKKHGDREESLYTENTEIAKTEPDHPDFSSYMSVGWGGRRSPKSFEELQALSIDELVEYFVNYEDSGRFDDPGIEGLVSTFKEVVKSEPLKFYLNLGKFTSLDLAYIYEITEAYKDLWVEKGKYPWDEIWHKLLDFCSIVVNQKRFWASENAQKREPFVANRYWIVGSIGRLIEEGTKSDKHAFSEDYLQNAEEILKYILNREEGSEFEVDSDAVSIAINSPRGQCLEALINLALRSCRIADENNNKDHSEVWSHFQPYFDSELSRGDSDNPEYEFAILVTNYLSNFLYLSKQWVTSNLSKIFNQKKYQKWLCAMQGYACVGVVYQEIYIYLKEHGDLLKVLDDEIIKDKVREKVIQNIIIAYINDFESLEEENTLINILLNRNDHEEISHLIWFMSNLRKKGDDKLRDKVFNLWPKILQNIDLTTRVGKETASQLCHWAGFVDQIDETNRRLLLEIAPYSDESHNSYIFLKSISEISEQQPFEAQGIWMKMLEGSTQDYPEDAVIKILTNLNNMGSEGLRKAREVESEYLKNGNERPSLWLKQIREEMMKSE